MTYVHTLEDIDKALVQLHPNKDATITVMSMSNWNTVRYSWIKDTILSLWNRNIPYDSNEYTKIIHDAWSCCQKTGCIIEPEKGN